MPYISRHFSYITSLHLLPQSPTTHRDNDKSLYSFNPLNPHDALKHHFTTLKTDLIFLQLMVLEGKFPWSSFTTTWQFSLIFQQRKIFFIGLVVDEYANGKVRLERVNESYATCMWQMFLSSRFVAALLFNDRRHNTHYAE